jgi:hypothetical protein
MYTEDVTHKVHSFLIKDGKEWWRTFVTEGTKYHHSSKCCSTSICGF